MRSTCEPENCSERSDRAGFRRKVETSDAEVVTMAPLSSAYGGSLRFTPNRASFFQFNLRESWTFRRALAKVPSTGGAYESDSKVAIRCWLGRYVRADIEGTDW